MYSQFFARSLVVIITVLAANSVALGAVTVAIKPGSAVTVPVNGTRQFGTAVTGTTNKSVTWSLTAPAGANAGTITGNGKYTAPPTPLPDFASVTVTATSVADTSAKASNTISVRNTAPLLKSVTPTSVGVGEFNLTVNGSRFANGAQVLWNGTPLTTQFVSSSRLTATGKASQTGTVRVTVANPGPEAVSAPVIVTVFQRVSVTLTPASASVQTDGTQQFQAVVSGSSNQGVTWGIIGDSTAGSINPSGLYTAPSVAPVAGTVTVYAVAAADGKTRGTATISIQDPGAVTYGRFLEQATFGPTPALISHVKQVGMSTFLDEQFDAPESSWPPLATATRASAVDAFFANALNGQDQLRQRVLGALSEIIVVSMNKNTNGNEIVPWLQVLSRNAFGNYRTLLKEMTLDASMGKYLDLVNSGVRGGAANENFPRELMQLFSLGLSLLNLDGSVQKDGQGIPLATYTQTDVQQLALALTGWTYSSADGTVRPGGNYSYYPGPMVPVPGKHNTLAKTILGQPIPADQTIQQDLDSAIDIIFNHPNIGPFVATRLIRALVTSNPSAAYISRVATAFNGSGGNARGDMRAVIRAVLLDPEARDDNPPADFGRLRTPMQHTVAMARALNVDPGPASQFAYLFNRMNEGILNAPTVFGHYSPLFQIPNSPLFGPEFQIYSASDAVNRANFLYKQIYSPWPIDPALQPFVAVAGDPAALITAIDNALLFGRMLPQTRTAIQSALPAQHDNNQRVLTALYLTFTSGEYLVQH